jgi:hypothetical protein
LPRYQCQRLNRGGQANIPGDRAGLGFGCGFGCGFVFGAMPAASSSSTSRS